MLCLFIIRRRPLSRLRSEKKGQLPTAQAQPGVTVVVYAHNQADDLLRNLPSLLSNDYPDFEVVVVDDGSTDDTENVLTQMDQRSEHFFHTTIAERVRTVSHHKLAMMLGVKAAHNEFILMTQAQCVPKSSRWIASMMKHFTEGVDAVIGPSVFENRTGFINRFYQWDYFNRMLTMMSLTSAVKTYGGWSCNMAFRKSLFYANRNHAFSSHLDLHPGEDDIFLRESTVRSKATGKYNVTAACSEDALIINQLKPLHYYWSKDRLMRAFTHRYYFITPRLANSLDVFTRYATILSGLALIGASVWFQSWWIAGSAAVMFLLFAISCALIPYYTARRFGSYRFLFSPMVYGMAIPFINMLFSLRASLSSKKFYVGRI